ncbi:PadR family transcriptional regulator [Nakamurella lactea]|uniref:PadR family transcriptional regulator n=1 Tax=Nakamurella lactea TaxID=459515 RepID=UPI00040DAAC7|nr:PadR family transcriptional regulator [Nakamurella lactea]
MSSLLGDQKINPLGMVALGLLTEGSRHPYEMYQVLMRRREDVIVKIRPGSLYHAIARLEQLGFVTAVGTERDGNRPERTTYQITDNGRHVLRDLVGNRLANPENEYPIFPVAVAQVGRLPKEEARRHLQYRLDILQRDAEVMRDAYGCLIERGKPAHMILDLHYLIAMKDAEISWLTTTIDAIDSARLDWKAV